MPSGALWTARILLFSVFNLIRSGHAADPVPVDWSDKVYGPDGPWYAVKTFVGSQRKQIDLLPGAIWWTNVLSSDYCDESKDLQDRCYAKSAGLYDAHSSHTSFTMDSDVGTPSWAGDLAMGGKSTTWADKISFQEGGTKSFIVPNSSILVASQAYGYYPNGKKHPFVIGQLCIGAWGLNNFVNGVSGNMPPNYLSNVGNTKSPSFGLHVGSATAGIKPSLYFGGYDAARALGNVAVKPIKFGLDVTNFPINLKEIGLTSTSSLTDPHLLRKGNSSIKASLPLGIGPWNPYMNLPKSVCDAITARIPVSFSRKLGYYLWDVNDSNYKKIVNSSSHLTFTFDTELSSYGSNLQIRIPLQLLHLTLDAPIVDKPTPYFPCVVNSDGYYRLGQAFLQAAYFVVNWGEATDSGVENGYFWLAQAPGPNVLNRTLATTIMADSGSTLLQGTNSVPWEQTWDGHWTPINEVGDSDLGPNDTDSGLSTGAKAGIGVGIALMFVISAGLVIFWISRRRKKRQTYNNELKRDSPVVNEMPGTAENRTLLEVDGSSRGTELWGERQHLAQELPATNQVAAELE